MTAYSKIYSVLIWSIVTAIKRDIGDLTVTAVDISHSPVARLLHRYSADLKPVYVAKKNARVITYCRKAVWRCGCLFGYAIVYSTVENGVTDTDYRDIGKLL